MTFYNEHDPNAAAWLRELIARELIAPGVVDERSITDIQPHELHGYTQCHFFAGIGGWSLALRLAGWSDTEPVWTGSCPCQPFSVAGKGLGDADERHLWPAFCNLIAECRPHRVFGEQVASAIGKGWLDGVSADLEENGYACGSAVLGAHSVGAPHQRQRLFWVADATSDAGAQHERESRGGLRRATGPCDAAERGSDFSGLAHCERARLQGHAGNGRDGHEPGRLDALADGSTAASGADGRMAEPECSRREASGLRYEIDAGRKLEQGCSLSRLGDATEHGCEVRRTLHGEHDGEGFSERCEHCRLGIPDSDGRTARDESAATARHWHSTEPASSGDCGMGDAGCGSDERRGEAGDVGCSSALQQSEAQKRERGGDAAGDPISHNFWIDSRLIKCRDGKLRRVPTEPALFPLADGIPYKLARRGSIRPALLKGAGNAIVPQVAAEFIRAASRCLYG